MRITITAIFSVIVLVVIFFCLDSKWHFKNGRSRLDSNVSADLERLGDAAITTLDVPVAALLLYNNNIIGEGYNTVRRDMLAGGHAEINAISFAIRRAGGLDSFMNMDRKKLTLITTWEPCYMCQGAIVEYDIRHVIIIKSKPLLHWFRKWEQLEIYKWNKQEAVPDSLQDKLFRKHPFFEQEKARSDF